MFSLLFVLFCLYFSINNNFLNVMLFRCCKLKSFLEFHLSTLERYLSFYLISCSAIIAILFIFLGIVLYYKKPTVSETIFYPSATNPVWKFLLAWFVLLTISMAIMWVRNRGYVTSLYGRHITKLKQLLAQINE